MADRDWQDGFYEEQNKQQIGIGVGQHLKNGKRSSVYQRMVT